MNNLDRQYQALLQDILDNGYIKKDRTGTGTISVFGRQIRHRMSQGFPLLTTKKMAWKSIVTELLWFLRGDTNIKYLVDNGCHIWDGDAYKAYLKKNNSNPRIYLHSVCSLCGKGSNHDTDYSDDNDTNCIHCGKEGKWEHIYENVNILTKEEFIECVKTDSDFAAKWGELGPIYGKQWRKWNQYTDMCIDNDFGNGEYNGCWTFKEIDQIVNSINLLKTDPDSRRNRVNAWNVGEIDSMVLPPCHTDFQFYTRELSQSERLQLLWKVCREENIPADSKELDDFWLRYNEIMGKHNIPKRAISLMWNQRSADVFLGIPFNIASYGLLLEIIAMEVNMIPEELIGNLGDTHLYINHIEQAKEQLNRNPYTLPKLKLDGWLGAMTPNQIREEGFLNLIDNGKILPSHFTIENYQSHPTIKAPLSN